MADVNVFGHACEIFVSQYVIGCTCHNESMLIGLFLTKAFANERKWLFKSADTRGRGTLDEPLRSVKHADRTYTGRGPTGSIFVCGILHHCIKRFFLGGGGRRYFRSDILFIYNMIWPCSFFGAVFVCPQSPNTDNILDQFSYCPLSGDLHVTFANPEIFGFEFHLRSSPCEFSRRSVNQPVALLIAATTRR